MKNNNKPKILIEFLEASRFLAKVKNLIEKERISIRKPVLVNR